ncbi:50S ribosomal protein L25 [Candidatus Cyrtobacter comes]|uniref:Large ribosomal subunit protein bL25 n=1 Tax=Candidatus Cyrtobacter comes TaxID=675776 RepID=A0ABU5L794_9RICK|nr:50S ribosomal protein L25/general stress protein Ctc [Candidatus Cyrtobacter comes]MDZ5761996.1 50S ribosomal protein L25 [Candidatus Cyrtobacter comes]
MTLSFVAKVREVGSKGSLNSLRASGYVPAVLYGAGRNLYLSVNSVQLLKEMSKGGMKSKLLELDLNGEKIFSILKDVQLHPVKDTVEHVDFKEVDLDVETRFPVKVKFLNTDKCIGIKKGGVLNIVCDSIHVLCKPALIPSYVEVDSSLLNIGSSVHLRDIILPEGVTACGDLGVTIASIVGKSSSQSEDKQGAE